MRSSTDDGSGPAAVATVPRLPDPIEIHDLTKRYGSTLAVEALSFRVAEGRIVGFLGPNGAGKTTTLRSLLGLIKPTSGRTLIEGKPFVEAEEPVRTVRGFSLGLDGKLVAELLAGMAIAGALMAAIGVGIGAMIRKQTAAVVGILVYLLLLEPLVTSVAIKSLDRFSIGNALAQLTSTARVNGLDHAFGQVTGGLLLAGYAVVLVLAGAIVIQTRDITD